MRLVAAIALAAPLPRAGAEPFEARLLRVPFAVEQPVAVLRLSASPHRDIAAFGEDEAGKPALAVFRAEGDSLWPAEPDRLVPLPEELVAYDVGPVPGSDRETLYFLTGERVLRWDADDGDLVSVADAASLYRQRPQGRLPEVDFLRDLDADGDLDLVVPDFAGYRVAFAVGGTFGPPQMLAVPAEARHVDEGVSYEPAGIEIGDLTAEAAADAVVVRDGELRIYAVRDGEIASDPVRVRLPIELSEPPDREEMSEVDQRNQTWTSLVRVADFDGDGLVDLLTQTVHSTGVFDKWHSLALHRGRRSAGAVAFAPEPSSQIRSSLIVGEPVVEDLDRDGKLDLALGSVEIGLGALVTALVTGTIDVDLAVHRMRTDGRFEEEPGAHQQVSIDFDLGSGRATIPLVRLADVDGDGRKDFLIGEGTAVIRVHRGVAGARPFAEEAQRYETSLPANGSLASVADVDGDGREDLVLRYGKLDPPGADRTVRLLLAR